MSSSALPPYQDPDAVGTDDSEVVPQITQKQAKRINAPVRGMVISMAVLLLLLLPFLWLQPKPDGKPFRADVNVAEEAGHLAKQTSFTPLAPELGENWTANYARWNAKSEEGVPLWSVGYLSPDSHLIEAAQTAKANPTWLAQRTEMVPVTGERNINGVKWEEHHQPERGKTEEFTAWVGTLKDSTVVLSGQATEAEFEHVATAISGS